jgi:cold shock CspA family protein
MERRRRWRSAPPVRTALVTRCIERASVLLDAFLRILEVRHRPFHLERPADPVGAVSTGRITKLFVGQMYGFIRVRAGRDVFFHRADLQDVTTFNTLNVGDLVTFSLIDDPVSGARAVRVTRTSRTS